MNKQNVSSSTIRLNRYNWLPPLQGYTLELGGGSGFLQLRSRYHDYFESDNYLNVDLNGSQQVRTIESDILDLDLDREYDNIIMFDVLEHFPLRDVPALVKIIGKHLAKDGILYLTVPYKEKIHRLLTYNKEYYMIHNIYDFDHKLVAKLLPGFEIIHHQVRRKINWGYDHKPGWWKFGRVFKRMIRGNFWEYRSLYLHLRRNDQ